MKLIAKSLAVAACAAGLSVFNAGAATYELDVAHTYIGFQVRHMVVSNTKGNFGEFTGSIQFDAAAPETLSASAEVAVKSVNTDNEKRDDHLRSPDFFDAAQFPTIAFKTTRVEGTLPNVTLVGDLTIKGVTKEVSIPAEFNGPVTDPWGNERIGFSGSTKINRQEFGLTWSKTMDGGGLVVGDEVKIVLEVEAIKK